LVLKCLNLNILGFIVLTKTINILFLPLLLAVGSIGIISIFLIIRKGFKMEKHWSTGQIGFAAAVSGPIGGAYLIGRNFETFGERALAKRCYLAGVLITLFLTTLLVFLPDGFVETIPSSFIPGMSAVFSIWYVKSSQIEKIEKEKRHSIFWCFLLTLSILVLQIPALFLYSILLGSLV
jgi:hypothetical protein